MRLNLQDYNRAVELLKKYKSNDILFEKILVENALKHVSNNAKYVFDQIYLKEKNKYQIITSGKLSERTFERRKQELIYAVHHEIKKQS